MALPSANLAYWLVPHELQLRVALAETMARPDLSELAPTSSNNAINGQPQLSYSGTAGLKPVKAEQADLSLEWYYGPHAALTAAVFAKKITQRHLHGRGNRASTWGHCSTTTARPGRIRRPIRRSPSCGR